MSQEKKCACPLCHQTFAPSHGLTAKEHLARGILRAYAEMQGKGNYINNLPCPRCGEYTMAFDILKNEPSHQFDVRICNLCKSREGVEATEGNPVPLESWWAVVEILNRK